VAFHKVFQNDFPQLISGEYGRKVDAWFDETQTWIDQSMGCNCLRALLGSVSKRHNDTGGYLFAGTTYFKEGTQ
jgi:hypothetical protein